MNPAPALKFRVLLKTGKPGPKPLQTFAISRKAAESSALDLLRLATADDPKFEGKPRVEISETVENVVHVVSFEDLPEYKEARALEAAKALGNTDEPTDTSN